MYTAYQIPPPRTSAPRPGQSRIDLPIRQLLERRLAMFLTLLEPAMILLMGGVVLTIVLAILLPIMEINQLVR